MMCLFLVIVRFAETNSDPSEKARLMESVPSAALALVGFRYGWSLFMKKIMKIGNTGLDLANIATEIASSREKTVSIASHARLRKQYKMDWRTTVSFLTYARTTCVLFFFFFWEPFFYEDCSIILQLEKNPRKFSMYCCTKCLARPVPFAKGPSRENFTDDSLTIHADDFFIPKRKKFETNRPDLLRKNTPVLKLLTWVKLISSFRNNSHFSVK